MQHAVILANVWQNNLVTPADTPTASRSVKMLAWQCATQLLTKYDFSYANILHKYRGKLMHFLPLLFQVLCLGGLLVPSHHAVMFWQTHLQTSCFTSCWAKEHTVNFKPTFTSHKWQNTPHYPFRHHIYFLFASYSLCFETTLSDISKLAIRKFYSGHLQP